MKHKQRIGFRALPILSCCANTIGAAIFLRLQAKHGEKTSAKSFSRRCRFAPPSPLNATLLVALHLFSQNSPINLAVLTRNGNTEQEGFLKLKITSDAAVRTQHPTIGAILTYLSFRWTLLLQKKSLREKRADLDITKCPPPP